ncbi:SDR family oxidoreductase [Vibrio campbellii]|jgi:acetoacetyl-CoA reductase|uniref:SDR family oxidoreductase n=1 Tax=Vibrio campbellii TaxID=680 RepID=UPI001F444BC9|nr:SDR family oxidoreductase [Vibrio campbellii]MCE7733171.1 SDR family oxidoreductase [Vibrio campbellii]
MSNKTALVSGAHGAIGISITERLLLDGYSVIAVLSHREFEKKKKFMIEKMSEFSSKISFLELDVANYLQCKNAIELLLDKYGVIDVVINNAGITRDSVFKKMTAQAWNDVINTNLNSLFNVTQPLFAAMCEKGGGRIINISSVNGLKGQFGQANYSAAKAGMIGFSKALAYEGARSGVTVNVIAPGYTGTPMVEQMKPEVLESITSQIPMKRLATPEEIAASVSFLVSDAGAYITGETLSVNGGLYMH